MRASAIAYWILLAAGLVLLALPAAWAAGALYYDLPIAALRVPAASIFAVGMVAAIFFIRRPWKKTAIVFTGFALVLGWWLTLKPTGNRNWRPDAAQQPWAEIDGDSVTLHNVRNFDYRSTTDYTQRWETRSVKLSQITGIDLFINYWGSAWMAHPIVSFQFADAPPVAMSIEVRPEAGRDYSVVGAIYRQYELLYIAADERDVVRLRTNFRKEDIYLYRLNVTPAEARERFLEYVSAMNNLRATPRWYNAVTTNCTTSIRAQRPPGERTPWDWRILLNGKADEMLYEHGAFAAGNLPFHELKQRSLIDKTAIATGDAPDFSARIRAGMPGFDAAAPAQP